jgi:hypothetical protein
MAERGSASSGQFDAGWHVSSLWSEPSESVIDPKLPLMHAVPARRRGQRYAREAFVAYLGTNNGK